MRGADGGPWHRLCALPAFWVGLLYDADSLASCADIFKSWSAEEREQLRRDVARVGLAAEIQGRSVRDIAAELLALSGRGLERRQRLDEQGRHEGRFLDSLNEIVERGSTPAEVMLDQLENDWGGDINRIFSDCAY